jgi:hypothetical protein
MGTLKLWCSFLLCLSPAIVFLAACATSSGTPTYIHVCPIVPQYSKAFEQEAAKELAAIPPNLAITKMLTDYIAVRAEAKACH